VTVRAPRKEAGYPSALNTLADHLKARILDLGVTQKGAAEHLGVHATSVANWLKGRRGPDLRCWPQIIWFLGYDPRPAATSVGEALVKWREGRGQSQKELAGQLQVDPGTLARWERGERAPTGGYAARVKVTLQS
jgi:transcriptional regulator with XRE-family HTH domain